MKVNGLQVVLSEMAQHNLDPADVRWVGGHNGQKWCSWDDFSSQLQADFYTYDLADRLRYVWIVCGGSYLKLISNNNEPIRFVRMAHPTLIDREPGFRI